MSGIQSMLDNLYANEPEVHLEKTAEEALMGSLMDEGQVSENPYAHVSTEDLESILGTEKTASEGATALEIIGGQVMAHAARHEAGLMKMASMQGLCRVCKDSPMDLQGTTVCSQCTSLAQD